MIYKEAAKMVIKSSTTLRNKYLSISDLAHKKGEPIYITKNGEGDLVVMSVEAFEKREAMMKFREKILFAEQCRVSGEPTVSIEKAAALLRSKHYEKVQS